mmetsp:Transcript_25988/g.83587  ORF Transcript_25988/g.83587 Transcript_25988/m.83587 type:complete len:243 (-) Transcript_25988:300-1028(-)
MWRGRFRWFIPNGHAHATSPPPLQPIASSHQSTSMSLREYSMPRKQAALAGNARAMAGPTPLYREPTPSSRTMRPNTSTMPLYVPSGAVCSRDLTVSGAMAMTQLKMPARPPAVRMASGGTSLTLPPAGVSDRFMPSYTPKYAMEPSPSRTSVAAEPRNTERMPPSRYRCLTTSTGPFSSGCPGCAWPWPWIWRTHLIRSPGAIMAVVGTAERPPAMEICVNDSSSVSGVPHAFRTMRLPMS